MPLPTVDSCLVVDLPKITDPRGNLSFVEGGNHIPFEIAHAFFIYDVPTAEERGAHAHKSLQQFVVCLSGGLDVELNDGTATRVVSLDRPWRGLYVPPFIWAREINFDPGTVYFILASQKYSADDYLRDFEDFRRYRAGAPA